MPRKSGTSAGGRKTRAEDLDDLLDNDGTQANIGDIEEDESMLEILNMLTEFKRKTPKSSSTAFQTKKNALSMAARRNAQAAVRDGIAYIEQYKASISQIRSQEVSLEQHLAELTQLSGQEETVEAIFGWFSFMFEDLSHRRAAGTDETSAMRASFNLLTDNLDLRGLLDREKAHINEDMENQKIATDATALIKHYKALLSS